MLFECVLWSFKLRMSHALTRGRCAPASLSHWERVRVRAWGPGFLWVILNLNNHKMRHMSGVLAVSGLSIVRYDVSGVLRSE